VVICGGRPPRGPGFWLAGDTGYVKNDVPHVVDVETATAIGISGAAGALPNEIARKLRDRGYGHAETGDRGRMAMR
jgi:hypothetical protein